MVALKAIVKEDMCCLRHADLYAPQGVDLGEGGSLSYCHDTVKVIGLGCMIIVKQSQKYLVFMGRYIKLLHLHLLTYLSPRAEVQY